MTNAMHVEQHFTGSETIRLASLSPSQAPIPVERALLPSTAAPLGGLAGGAAFALAWFISGLAGA